MGGRDGAVWWEEGASSCSQYSGYGGGNVLSPLSSRLLYVRLGFVAWAGGGVCVRMCLCAVPVDVESHTGPFSDAEEPSHVMRDGVCVCLWGVSLVNTSIQTHRGGVHACNLT